MVFGSMFLVTSRIGEVAYHLDLKGQLTRICPAFHMSLLRRFVASGGGIKHPEPIEVKDPWEYMVECLLAHQHQC